MLPATAPVPLKLIRTVRSVSFVRSPLVKAPVTGATLSVTEVIAGALGAVVSIVTVKLPEAALWLPAPSVMRDVIA